VSENNKALRLIITFPSKGKRLRKKQILFNDPGARMNLHLFPPKAVLQRQVEYILEKGIISPKMLSILPSGKLKKIIYALLKDFRESPDAYDLEDFRPAKNFRHGEKQPLSTLGRWPQGSILGLQSDSDGTETGFSMSLIGSSFSGKTHLLVSELNKLVTPAHKTSEYEIIVLFTESKNAADIKKINSNLPLVVIEGWDPEIPLILKKINDKTGNRFRALIILDDIVDQRMSKQLTKMLLTYRNSNISTCILLQYPKLLNKATRGSLHYVYITGFRSMEDWEAVSSIFDLVSFAKQNINEETGREKSSIKKDEAYGWLKSQVLPNNKYMFIDQRQGKDPLIHTM
jgi:hypothetical protein